MLVQVTAKYYHVDNNIRTLLSAKYSCKGVTYISHPILQQLFGVGTVKYYQNAHFTERKLRYREVN